MEQKREILNAWKRGIRYRLSVAIDDPTRYGYEGLSIHIFINEKTCSICIHHVLNGTYYFASLRQMKIERVVHWDILLWMIIKILPIEMVMEILESNPYIIAGDDECPVRLAVTDEDEQYLVYLHGDKYHVVLLGDSPLYVSEVIYKHIDISILKGVVIPVPETKPISFLGWRGRSWGMDMTVC